MYLEIANLDKICHFLSSKSQDQVSRGTSQNSLEIYVVLVMLLVRKVTQLDGKSDIFLDFLYPRF